MTPLRATNLSHRRPKTHCKSRKLAPPLRPPRSWCALFLHAHSIVFSNHASSNCFQLHGIIVRSLFVSWKFEIAHYKVCSCALQGHHPPNSWFCQLVWEKNPTVGFVNFGDKFDFKKVLCTIIWPGGNNVRPFFFIGTLTHSTAWFASVDASGYTCQRPSHSRAMTCQLACLFLFWFYEKKSELIDITT